MVGDLWTRPHQRDCRHLGRLEPGDKRTGQFRAVRAEYINRTRVTVASRISHGERNACLAQRLSHPLAGAFHPRKSHSAPQRILKRRHGEVPRTVPPYRALGCYYDTLLGGAYDAPTAEDAELLQKLMDSMENAIAEMELSNDLKKPQFLGQYYLSMASILLRCWVLNTK